MIQHNVSSTTDDAKTTIGPVTTIGEPVCLSLTAGNPNVIPLSCHIRIWTSSLAILYFLGL